jgi:hypothetical protein
MMFFFRVNELTALMSWILRWVDGSRDHGESLASMFWNQSAETWIKHAVKAIYQL